MIDAFLMVGLPYIAMVVCIVGCIWRWKFQRYTYSSLSSQFLENKQLLWGSAPWHIGILVVLIGHLVAVFLPNVWSSLMSNQIVLLATEGIGIGCALLCIGGLVVLIVRRLTSLRIQAVTTTMDLLVLALLLVQVILGLLTAVLYRWGAVWSTGTVVPYFWSLVALQPNVALVADFPAIIKLHMIGGWLFFLVLPFSRLVHFLVVPVGYLFRAPQLVIWNNSRHRDHSVQKQEVQEGRRHFIKGLAGVVVAGGLLSTGVLERVARYFKGPKLEGTDQVAVLEKKLQRLKLTAEERALELERKGKEYIPIARYSELSATKGKYFIDYTMTPALAFLGADALPLLVSAKCTHLGCTVGCDADDKGRVLCPCHVSYFNIATGMPNDGAPAKLPLAHLGWVLMDGVGKIVISRGKDGVLHGENNPALLAQCQVCIVRPLEEGVS
jgi:nitrate reductase gamma subunit